MIEPLFLLSYPPKKVYKSTTYKGKSLLFGQKNSKKFLKRSR
jgi:hypothetical protein